MKLILARHGQTTENISGLLMGQRPGQLSKKGQEQAQNLARKLRNVEINTVISSDLARARNTASVVALECCTHLMLDRRLRERAYGIYEGRPVSDLVSDMEADELDYVTFNPAGGESCFDFTTRVLHFLRSVYERYYDETVCLVSHNGVIKVLLNLFADLRIENNGQDAVGNGEAVIVNIAQDGTANLESAHELDAKDPTEDEVSDVINKVEAVVKAANTLTGEEEPTF